MSCFHGPCLWSLKRASKILFPPQKKNPCDPRVCLCQLLKGGILSFLLINYSVKCCVVSFVGSIASDFYSLAHKKNIFVIGNSCCVPAPRANNFRRQALIFNLMSSTPLSCSSSLWLLGLLQMFCTVQEYGNRPHDLWCASPPPPLKTPPFSWAPPQCRHPMWSLVSKHKSANQPAHVSPHG